jgi:hypothetical protein
LGSRRLLEAGGNTARTLYNKANKWQNGTKKNLYFLNKKWKKYIKLQILGITNGLFVASQISTLNFLRV